MSLFTDYVRSLGPGVRPADRELAGLWRALSDAVHAELRRRGLWDRPPSYLGVVGWQSWEGTGESARRAAEGDRRGALAELTADAYTYVFVDRLRSLEAQLRVKPEIEGLVVLNVRHFVHDRQRAHDPLGFRVFEVVRAAVRGSLAAGDLHLLGGDPRIRNETELGFRPAAALPPPPGPDLGVLAVRWNDELLPSLVSSQGKRQEDVARRLRRRLPELRDEGVEAFLFRDLVKPLQHDARTRWAALLGQSAGDVVWAEGRGETGEPVRVAAPDTGFDDRESFDRLVRQVAESLYRLETDDRTRGYLASLWSYLSRWAGETAEPAARPWRVAGSGLEPVDPKTDRFSQRKIASQLGIPRERLPELLATLEGMIAECRASDAGRPGPRHRQEG
jgi:hypothetical protein